MVVWLNVLLLAEFAIPLGPQLLEQHADVPLIRRARQIQTKMASLNLLT